jgi:hypothetical protein
VSVVCCQVEVSATSWSLVQRSPTDCGVSKVCDREASTKRGGPGPYRAVEPLEKKKRKSLGGLINRQDDPRLQVPTVVVVTNTGFWDVIPYSQAEIY